MAVRKIALSRPDTGEEEWLALKEPLMSGWLTQGPQVAAFETEFASRYGLTHALATSNCSTGLHLILAGMGLGPGDEVIVPAFTWVATANAVMYTGATPVFADVCPKTYNLSPDSLGRLITPKTRAIVAVHLFGLCADINAIRAIAGEIPIIEDAACATGSRYHGAYAGSLGLAAAFSFHPRKTLTTGEGGMVTTADAQLAGQISALRNHGASLSAEQQRQGPKPYLMPDFDLLGYNYRMTDLQAAVGRVQLGKMDRFLAERREAADDYLRELAGLDWLQLPEVPSGYDHSWQAFVCAVNEEQLGFGRNELMDRLETAGIGTRPGTHAVHQLGFYRERFGLRPEDCPAARDCDRFTVALPLHNQMTAEDYAYVVETLTNIKVRS